MRTSYFSAINRYRARNFVAALLIVFAAIFNQSSAYAVALVNPDCSKLFTPEHTLCGQNDILYSDDSCTPTSDSTSPGDSSTPAPGGGSVAADPDGWTYPTVQGSTSISSEYDENRGSYVHRGVDLAGPLGTPIYASRDGKVIEAGDARDPNGFKNWVVIQHDENGQRVDTVYGHMTLGSIIVKPGDTVKAGQQIAGIGSEGGSSGPHLHYEEWPGGRGGGSDRKPVAVYGGAAVPPSQPSSPANQAATEQTTTTPSSEEACTTSGAGPDNGGTCQEAQPGADNAKIIWDYLRGRGLSKEQTAGILGNLRQESGPNLDPGINETVASYAGAGYGIAQWTGGRRTSIESAAAAKGVPVNDLCFQLDYLVEESMSRQSLDGGGLSEWDGLKKQGTVEDAVDYWHANFERSADANTGTRQQFAREYMKKYGN